MGNKLQEEIIFELLQRECELEFGEIEEATKFSNRELNKALGGLLCDEKIVSSCRLGDGNPCCWYKVKGSENPMKDKKEEIKKYKATATLGSTCSKYIIYLEAYNVRSAIMFIEDSKTNRGSFEVLSIDRIFDDCTEHKYYIIKSKTDYLEWLKRKKENTIEKKKTVEKSLFHNGIKSLFDCNEEEMTKYYSANTIDYALCRDDFSGKQLEEAKSAYKTLTGKDWVFRGLF